MDDYWAHEQFSGWNLKLNKKIVEIRAHNEIVKDLTDTYNEQMADFVQGIISDHPN